MAQAKRSPIHGYNHNVKYRGVIFHVQTEDSGQQNPHLFTHLFHEGVIVSTRKLVYDNGSNEESIKSLMQSQHKAVMKDLKKGTFDDKIDAYLIGTPGLEPRPARASTDASPPPEEARGQLEIINDELSEPIELPVKGSRTSTSDRTIPIELPLKRPTTELDEPGITMPDMAAAVEAANAEPAPPPVKARTSTAQKVSKSGIAATPPAQRPGARSPVIEITEEEISSRLRMPRDTAVEMFGDVGDGVPGSDSSPAMTVPVRTGGERPAAHNAASLPSKPAARTPMMSPPIVTRPAEGHTRPGDSEAGEIYQSAPPSVEPPPGERSERAGTYSVTRKSGDAPIREKTGRIAAINPSTLGNDSASKTGPIPPMRPRPASDRDLSNRVPQSGRDPGSARIPMTVPREPTPGTAVPRGATPSPPPTPNRPGTPPPVRPSVTAPIANRSSTPANPQSNSGVVMTRPAVIVGAPPKPLQPGRTTRVRKAREDEGRGFGQGLISEKSLDEVILAYLSEDAEDK